MDPEHENVVSFKDIILNLVLPKLDQIDRKLDQKADRSEMNALEAKVEDIQMHGSRNARAWQSSVVSNAERIESLEMWRNRIIGAVTVISVVVVPLAFFLIAHLLH